MSFTVAIIGRPNVGKSSLLNRLLKEERVMVSDMPGTTRDAIDTLITFCTVGCVSMQTIVPEERGLFQDQEEGEAI